MKIIQTHEYYSKFRQHNGRVVKTGTVPTTAPRSTLKPRSFWQWGIMHLVRTQATCIYLFHFHKLILCGFNQIFLNHKWVFFNHNPSISTTNNPKQPFAINQFSHQSQPINIVHGLWMRGVYIYIYLYLYIAFHFYFNTYIIFTTHI